MHIRIKYLIALFSFLILFTNCVDNINDNPNAPTMVPTSSLLIASQKTMMDNLRGERVSLRGSMLFSQYFAELYYTVHSRYSIPSDYSDICWDGVYRSLSNLEEIIQLNTNPSTANSNLVSESGRNETQIAVCRILKTYGFQVLTDTYGDVPYQSYGNDDPDFEALQPSKNKIAPKYASQQKIYSDMLNELKMAADTLLKYPNELTMAQGDVIYGGSNAKWAKFANSLRLRIATRLKAKAKDVYEFHCADALSKGVLTDNGDNAVFSYLSTAPNAAPYYSLISMAGRNDYAVSHIVVNFLQGKNPQSPLSDPRLSKYAEATESGNYVGMPYGLTEEDAGKFSLRNISSPSVTVRAPDYAEVLMECAEVNFLISEYKAWDQRFYEEGVRASMRKWGVDEKAINPFIAALPKANEQNVMNQKYIALYMQGLEAWSEYRRTGYPTFLVRRGDVIYAEGAVRLLFEPLNGDGGIPQRMIYPVKEQNINRNNYQKAIKSQGSDNITNALWVFK